MKIIFLDFDGVLATASHCLFLSRHDVAECDEAGRTVFDPVCVGYLRSIIQATGADVVITSSWKYIDSYQSLLRMWQERSMPGFLTDVTPNVSRHRGDDIDEWLRSCPECINYVILDDLDKHNFNADQLPHLITVDSRSGLDSESSEKAIKILNEGLR